MPVLLAFGLINAGLPAGADTFKDFGVAVLQGLDRVTARVSPIEIPIDATDRFGTLEITVRACRKRPPEEPPEAAAFVEITEVRPGEAGARLFSGWMFASSPALSALEHAVYDITVVDCRDGEPEPPQ